MMKRAGLQNKIMTTVIILILLIGMAVSFALKALIAPAMRKELIKKGTAVAELTSGFIPDIMEKDDARNLIGLLNTGKSASKDISYMILEDGQGHILAHTFQKDVPGYTLSAKERREGTKVLDTEKGLVYDIAIPVKGTGLILRTGMGPGLLRKRIAGIAGLIIALTLLAIMFGALMAYGLSSVIIKPIQKLTQGAKTIGEGNLSHKIEINTGDEIEDLSREFNKMAEKLNDSYSNLEDKVKIATDSLMDEKNRLESVINSMGEGLFITDRDRNIISWNSSAKRLTGYHEKDVLGRKCYDILHICLEDGKNLCKESCPMLESFGSSSIMSFPINPTPYALKKDGKKIPVAAMAAAIKDKDGDILGGVETFRDVSREKEIDKMRSEFVSLVSHELRTPLTAIKGFTDTLLRKDINIDSTTAKEYLKIIQRQSNRLSRLIGDFLDVSKIESGKMEMRWEKINITDIIDELINDFRTKSEKHSFKIVMPKKFPLIIADRDKISQVLINLIDNAIKYSPEGGKVTISGEEGNDFVKINISDQGIGIKEEDMQRLFKKFQRINPEISRSTQGTGLGLAICLGLIKLHDGNICVDSEFGEGTTFSFSLAKEPGRTRNKQ